MKRYFVFLLLQAGLLVSSCGFNTAVDAAFPVVDTWEQHTWTEDVAAEFAADPSRAGGFMTQYDFESPRVVERAPEGYKPCYISHYSRHGARYLTSAEDYEYLLKLFRKGHIDGALTAEGERAYEIIDSLHSKMLQGVGSLTRKGAAQQARLARRMYANYPSVFKAGSHVEATSTDVSRCAVSMTSFLLTLKELEPSLEIGADISPESVRVNNPYRKSSLNKALTPEDSEYMHGSHQAWRKALQEMEHEWASSSQALGRIFADLQYAHRLLPDVADFLWGVYFYAAGFASLDFEDPGFPDFFSLEDRIAIMNIEGGYHYYKKGSNPDFAQRSRAMAAVLWNDIIEKAESDIASGECCARLRFGHDSVVCGLLPFLLLDGWGSDLVRCGCGDGAGDCGGCGAAGSAGCGVNYLNVARIWEVPMAANLQIVFYKSDEASASASASGSGSGSGASAASAVPTTASEPAPILIRVIYNEYSKKLPVADQSLAPYYRLDDVKSYYANL